MRVLHGGGIGDVGQEIKIGVIPAELEGAFQSARSGALHEPGGGDRFRRNAGPIDGQAVDFNRAGGAGNEGDFAAGSRRGEPGVVERVGGGRWPKQTS